MIQEGLRRVATYERVSSEDQKKRETIKTQTQEIARRLESDPEVRLVDRYVDDGVSGKVPFAQRPAGRRLLLDASLGRFDQVWVYKIDRLGRDDIDPLVVWRDLLALGVTVYSVTEGVIDPLIYGIRVAIAAQERRDFLQRSSAGMTRAAKEGRYTGGIAPLGYRVAGEKPACYLTPSSLVIWADLTEAALVRRIYEWLGLDHRSCRWIADELNRLGVPTVYERDGRGFRGKRVQGKWRAGRIRNLVVNPVYKGELRYGRRSADKQREVIVAGCPALVSAELWHTAQGALALNRSMAKNTKRIYMLRSKIVCGVCGLNFCGSWNQRDIWYRCNGKLTDRGPLEGRCTSKMVKGEYLDAIVWADIEQFLRNPGGLLHELALEASSDAAPAAEAERTTFEVELASLSNERELTLDLYTRRHIAAEELDKRMEGIKSQQVELERRLSLLQPVKPCAADVLPADLLDQIRTCLADGLDDALKQQIASMLVNRISVYPIMVDGRKTTRIVIEYRFVVSASTDTGSWQ